MTSSHTVSIQMQPASALFRPPSFLHSWPCRQGLTPGYDLLCQHMALELPRGLRINTVAPGWVRETLLAQKLDPPLGVPAVEVAQTYVKAIEGAMTGQTLDVVKTPS